ncbi:MAG: hypothetical protein O9284_06025 [Steroidobacteraceae bacterium]|jgi:hypothetical protein|nr:hypothetical protein [Steroidobacteraceae bacterium]
MALRDWFGHAFRPLAPVPLVFVACSSLGLLLAFQAGLLGLPLALILVSWIAKYAFVLLETEAHGRPPPVLSIEAVNPVGEWRPLAALAIVAVAVGVVETLESVAGRTVAGVAALALALAAPASLAVLAIEGHWLRALSPAACVAVARGLGSAYALLWLVPPGIAGLHFLLPPLPLLAELALGQLLLFGYATLLGGAIHERRLALGFEPMESPERDATRAARERDRELSRRMDEVYARVRAGHPEEGWALAQRCLEDGGRSPDRYRELRDRAADWDDRRIADALTRDLVARLLALGRGGDALLAVESWWRRGGSFRPQDARTLAQLVHLATTLGHPATADRLLEESGAAFAADAEIAMLLARRGKSASG